MGRVRVTVVPHTHWDREWYLPFEGFLEHLVPMMDTLLALADAGFPHFHLDGQTAMIDDYLAVRPERRADIRRLAREGRLSVGPWFTQMDEFLVSGESLIRNLERGLARARELGAPTPVGYLPDQFGHVGQMPQLLRRAGIDRAVVWRGVPRAIDRTAFWWEAPDGSRVLAEYLPYGYALGGDLRMAQDPRELARALRSAARLLAPFAGSDRVLVLAGSDHHGPDPTLPDRLARVRRVARDLDARIGPIADHLDRDVPAELPVWRGELRSAARAHLLPGVCSTRIHQKRERARVEALVERYAEPLAALVPGVEWPAEALDRAWTLLLWNGAHDSVCGCSVDEVARAVDARHAEARAIAEGVIGEALGALAARVSRAGVLRFNPSPFERDGVPGLGWRVDPSPFERDGVPGLGWRVDPSPPRDGTVPVRASVRGEWIAAGGVELRLVDEPDVGDLYNFCPAGGAPPIGPRRLVAEGQAATASFPGITVRIRFSRPAGGPLLRLDGVIRNRRPDHRLRLHVRLPQETGTAVAGSPFEFVERGLVSEGGDREAPSPTWPARGVVLAGGVALLAEGVIEYEVVDGRELAVTLLRSVGTISRPTLATRPGPAGPDIPTPEAQMIGETRFALGVLPAARRADLLPAWERFALPLLSARATGGGSLGPSGSLLRVDGAVLSSVRRRGDHLEATVWNPSPRQVEARVGRRALTLAPARIQVVPLP